jgi:inner membrane protein
MGPMIHSACVESWDAETGKGEERRTTEQRREFLLTAMPEQLQAASGRRHAWRTRPGPAQGQHLQPQDAPHGAVGRLASLQPHSTVKGSRMQCGAPIVMVAVGDARGIRTAQVSRWASRPGPQARHLPPHLQPRPARGAARRRARPGRAPDGHAGPGTGGHRAPVHRAPGRQHRGEDDGQLAPPLVQRALSAVRAHLVGPTASRPSGACHRWPPRRSRTLPTAGRRICAGSYDDAPSDHAPAQPPHRATAPTASAWPSSTR